MNCPSVMVKFWWGGSPSEWGDVITVTNDIQRTKAAVMRQYGLWPLTDAERAELKRKDVRW